MVSRLLAVALAVVLLAGCANPKGAGPATVRDPVELEPGLVVAGDLGAVKGTVRSDAGLAVGGARVLLVGSPDFTETEDDGAFLFVNVTPGPYTLRVEKSGFLVVEDPVVVIAGNLTRRDLVLLPDQSIGAGYRPHVHDYWGTETTRVIMDDAVDFSDSPQRGVAYANLGTTSSYDFPFALPEETPDGLPALVFPGTASLKVTLTWTSQDATLTKLQLKYSHAGSSETISLPEQPSGASWTIAVAPGQSDNGHQAFSLWDFAINAANDVRNAPDWEPGAILGSVHVKMEATKGEVVLEPEHPDFWAAGNVRVLRNASEEYRLGYSVADTGRETSQTGLIHIPSPQIVPPGTTRMRLDFSWTNARGGVPPEEWVLTWRSAEQHPHTTSYSEFHRGQPIAPTPNSKSYEFAVEPAQTDAFYQTKSLWRFLPSKAGDEGRTTPIYYEDFALDYIFRLQVTAYNDGLPTT